MRPVLRNACLAVLVLAGAGAAVTGGCNRLEKLLYNPKVKVKCQILHKRCLFENFGDPGEACVEVRVHHRESGQTLLSKPVCSGRIERDTPRWVMTDFGGDDPTALCMGAGLKKDFRKQCTVDIREVDR